MRPQAFAPRRALIGLAATAAVGAALAIPSTGALTMPVRTVRDPWVRSAGRPVLTETMRTAAGYPPRVGSFHEPRLPA